MPNTNDFKKSKKHKAPSKAETQLHEEFPEAAVEMESARRPTQEIDSVEEIPEVIQEPTPEEPQDQPEVLPDFRFNFFGAEIIRSRAPKAVELAEKVTGDWLQDGDFSELPINQPIVQFYLGEGLRKAKETEKKVIAKVESSNVVPVAKMVAESLISKILKK